MWNLPKGQAFLPDVPMARLRALYRSEQRTKPKVRLLAAIHRKAGRSMDEIAYLVSAPRNTVHGWLRRFAQRGLAAKDSVKQPGRPPALTLAQRKRLVRDLERGPPHNPTGLWMTKEIRELLKRKYGVEFVHQHIWRLLVSLGFSMQRPRKRHYRRPSDEEIAQFKKKHGEKRDITGERGLLWARRMRQPSALSPSSRGDGLDGGATPSSR